MSEPALWGRFWAHHQRHPEVYAGLERIALASLSAGHGYISVKRLYEILRMEVRTGEKPYELNNDFTAPYARLLIENHPELASVIRTRRSAADGQVAA